jgi:uncharacterized protein YdhG (YjbR/CyaY superfamily)
MRTPTPGVQAPTLAGTVDGCKESGRTSRRRTIGSRGVTLAMAHVTPTVSSKYENTPGVDGSPQPRRDGWLVMAVSPPATVEDYIGALDGDAQRVAVRLRDTIRAAAPGITDTIRYQMPCFMLDGTYIVYFGAWKKHVGFYPIPRFDAGLENELGAYRTAKDTVRFMYKDPVPWDLIERLVAELVQRARHPHDG